ncbi:di-heme oxidoredictase family protein [Sorangium sp. So ce1024]|uniref:di-heme oxidoredictase family protein n=1 Tax=Sorangium sp. So ce1024 TaxID=3133327 RepID=UPI003EFD98C8
MIERRSRRWVSGGFNVVLGLLATGAAGLGCTGDLSPAGETPPGEAPPGETPGGGGEQPGAPCAEAGGGPALPQAFALNCGGCHNAHGAPGGGFPDLFAFDGSLEAFTEQVRKGTDRMPAFDEQRLTASDLAAIYAYFSSGAPPAATCGGGEVTPGACSGVSGSVSPLFPAATGGKAITTRAADGTITLEAAGRVRGRHEREKEFSPFQPLYFENRSYKFVVEDTIPAGGSTIKFTWLPHANASDDQIINFRCWYTGDGNVFHANHGMKRITSTHWEFVVDRNARESREIREGDLLEFEFGVFLDPKTVEGRTSYYSDTFRYRVGSGELTPFDAPNEAALSGGAGTIPYIYEEPHLYYEQMALNIQDGSIQRFLEGRRLFHTDFATGEHTEGGNPVFDEHAGKAGPLANQTTCVGCHIHNGRGAPPEPGEAMETAVVKLFGAGAGADGGPSADPRYGRQLQDRALDGSPGEGTATVAYTEVPGQFPDGTPYVLRQPTFRFSGPAAGQIASYSVRVARPVVGMGLLEAIAEATVLERADGMDCNQDGISGRPNLIPDPVSGVLRIGRFGWKAGKVSVPHQVADALVADMGVTTRLFPVEECGEAQAGCRADTRGGPELSDEDLDRMAAYMRLLGVPPRRDTADPAVQRGEVLFSQAGCASCHVPTMKTGSDHPFVELRDQIIHPYSDLLLHDMGEALADTSTSDHLAGPREWRTPPLWGIGLLEVVNGHTQLLHDGRARDVVEAILWHGGEADSAKRRFMALPSEDRDALVAFLRSL